MHAISLITQRRATHPFSLQNSKERSNSDSRVETGTGKVLPTKSRNSFAERPRAERKPAT